MFGKTKKTKGLGRAEGEYLFLESLKHSECMLVAYMPISVAVNI